MPEETVGGVEVRDALMAAAEWLDRHRAAIDALNVFPVPDGDTGLNMSLTLRAAADETATSPGRLPEVAAAMARGALMGARGNSGVILAQLLRGIARAIDGYDRIDARALAAALSAGADAAYSAVEKPVEGTILTVARRASDAACNAASQSAGLIATLEAAHEAARVAVAETPELLPILKQAGVVDSGGEGLRVLLEGILLNLKGEPVGSGSIPIGMRVDFSSLHTDLDDFYGYCTEVLLRGDGLHQDTIRNQLAALGTCVLVVGDAEMMKVHVHTPRPGAVLDLATELGELVRVKVDNMQLQQREFAAAVAEGPSPEPSPAPLTDGTSVVAVALGTGFQQLFESYGAKVVSVDRTMNPSVQDLLQAIDQTDRTEVVVLPNDRNAAPAAEQAARERPDRTVTVVTTESMPAGLGALLALAPDLPAGANASAMAEAAARCHRVELARAVRSARLGDVQVRDGELFALLDGDPVASGNSYPEVLRMALDHVPHAPTEIATVYLGSQATTDLGDELANLIRDLFPIEVEVVFGGQPNFDYIVSLE